MPAKRRIGLFKNNIRFYLLIFAGILSLLLAAWLRVNIGGDKLYYIRLQQIYGFVSLAYWYLALLATPLGTVFGKEGKMRHYLFARRALGVSAAYFALLHVLISLFGQLGGLNGVLLSPAKFQQALIFGAVGFICLLLMAATSFDKVITIMTFPRWKWLHRTSYIAAVLVLLHIWIIGTHLTYPWLRWVLFGMLAVLIIAESWRVSLIIDKKSGEQNKDLRLALFVMMMVLLISALLYLPTKTESYHNRHEAGQHSEVHQ
jgi:sulfoxide reductase heme-binding subunit YedZ